MEIGTMAIAMNQAKLGQQISLSVAKMAMEDTQVQTDALTEMLSDPNLGANLDVRA